mmetsp:Transcript_8366/g.24081  ORF Transcript_8366/g.24081 Transcript_8366/m.24081 type:complete len:584 (+) Transcript_8366:668-2419(+)
MDKHHSKFDCPIRNLEEFRHHHHHHHWQITKMNPLDVFRNKQASIPGILAHKGPPYRVGRASNQFFIPYTLSVDIQFWEQIIATYDQHRPVENEELVAAFWQFVENRRCILIGSRLLLALPNTHISGQNWKKVFAMDERMKRKIYLYMVDDDLETEISIHDQYEYRGFPCHSSMASSNACIIFHAVLRLGHNILRFPARNHRQKTVYFMHPISLKWLQSVSMQGWLGDIMMPRTFVVPKKYLQWLTTFTLKMEVSEYGFDANTVKSLCHDLTHPRSVTRQLYLSDEWCYHAIPALTTIFQQQAPCSLTNLSLRFRDGNDVKTSRYFWRVLAKYNGKIEHVRVGVQEKDCDRLAILELFEALLPSSTILKIHLWTVGYPDPELSARQATCLVKRICKGLKRNNTIESIKWDGFDNIKEWKQVVAPVLNFRKKRRRCRAKLNRLMVLDRDGRIPDATDDDDDYDHDDDNDSDDINQEGLDSTTIRTNVLVGAVLHHHRVWRHPSALFVLLCEYNDLFLQLRRSGGGCDVKTMNEKMFEDDVNTNTNVITESVCGVLDGFLAHFSCAPFWESNVDDDEASTDDFMF